MGKFRSFLERDRAFEEELEANRYCNVAAAVIGGIAVVGSSMVAADGAESAARAQAQGMSSAAASNTEVANIQAQSAREYLDFQKQQYADLKPLAEGISQAQMDVMRQQIRIADQNEDRARTYFDYEQQTFRPAEERLVRDAEAFDTEERREQLARQGIADVASAYERQRQQAFDTLSRYGINPNSARFAAINAQLSQGEAADRAGVATRSREQAEQLGFARRLDTTALGRNLATNSSTAFGVATTAGNSAVNSGNSAFDSAAAPGGMMGNAYGQFSNQMGNAGSSYTNSGNIYARGYGIAAERASRASDAFSGLVGMGVQAGIGYMANPAGGWASAARGLGMKFADGGDVTERKTALHMGSGPVDGPGGPVDDKVPAMLSDGEYVLPADTVKRIGKNKLDKIVAETHTPASVQRKRKALKGA